MGRVRWDEWPETGRFGVGLTFVTGKRRLLPALGVGKTVGKTQMSHPFLCRVRSTRMKATSSAAKPHGSTSAAPWSTSSRSASGYRRWRSKACWRKRGKTRVSPTSPRTRAPNSSPVLPLKPPWSFSSSEADGPRLSPLFSPSRLHLPSHRPHADPETAFLAKDAFYSPLSAGLLYGAGSACPFFKTVQKRSALWQTWRPPGKRSGN